MGETTSEYMHLVVNTIIFCTAVSLVIALLLVLSKYNRTELESQRNKASVSMNTEDGYHENLIFVSGSEVFTDIVSLTDNLPVYLDATLIDADYLRNVREGNKTYVTNLKGRISFNDEYLVKYEYLETNEIKSVHYEHR